MDTEPTTVWGAIKALIEPAFIGVAIALLLIGGIVYTARVHPEYFSEPLFSQDGAPADTVATEIAPALVLADADYIFPMHLSEGVGEHFYVGVDVYEWAETNLLPDYTMVDYGQYRNLWVVSILGRPREGPPEDGSSHVLYALLFIYDSDTARWEMQEPWVACTLNEYAAEKAKYGLTDEGDADTPQ